jgi:glutamate racemase
LVLSGREIPLSNAWSDKGYGESLKFKGRAGRSFQIVMDNRPVLFFDSGAGGIPYCRDFIRRNPHEAVCYLADRLNFPYGPREKEELVCILISLTEKLLKTINPKIFVLACNTASISALAPLREKFPQLPFVGTVPAVKPAANASKCGKVGVLGTERTIEDIRGLNLAENCEIFGIAAPELVEFIEQRYEKTGEEERAEIVKKYIALFRAEKIDNIVLGCTHFLFLLEEFRREASPFIKIFDSLDGITKRVEYLLDEDDCALRAEEKSHPRHRLLLTGAKPSDSFWQNRAKALGFNLNLLSEI